MSESVRQPPLRPLFELVNSRDGSVIDKSRYLIKWRENYDKRVRRAAHRVLKRLEQIAMTSANPLASVAAIKELNARALGMPLQQIQQTNTNFHVDYAQTLALLNERMREEPKAIEGEVIPAPSKEPDGE